MHPRNRHPGRYDFEQLKSVSPELVRYVLKNPQGQDSIDFADPQAVKALNRALLVQQYGIRYWDIPENFLCPPLPGRADYVHHLADLLAASHEGVIPKGSSVRIFDVGVGANCIYPLIGYHEYGWSFVGSDIDEIALESSRRIIEANGMTTAVELRLQSSPADIFKGVVKDGEKFDAVICNPPFHSSPEEARERAERKWRNLGKKPVSNFGGQATELWCEGGEAGFIWRMIKQSALIADQCLWFTTLVSREATLEGMERSLRKVNALDVRMMEMAQGQKKSRLVAWTF